MKIDVVSIFPDYFSVLDISLMGRASENKLVEFGIHDLRQYATDVHRSVDDTPYGGGAGMVMMPEPWGASLDSLLGSDSWLVVPSPAGPLFTQEMAKVFAGASHLVFACGRYEGIDQRVIDHFATTHRVVEVSLGDYVLNGGEVAALAMIEATVRLIPGFMGNPDSLLEESHEDGLVEYPSYTKPRVWRGHEVPEVLLSGDHERVRQWRAEQSRARTAKNRPDLLGN